jgi:hypothetical protein
MMHNRISLLLMTLLLGSGLLAGTLTPAHASYLDLGSASYLFQVAIAGIVGLSFTIRCWFSQRHHTDANTAHDCPVIHQEQRTDHVQHRHDG